MSSSREQKKTRSCMKSLPVVLLGQSFRKHFSWAFGLSATEQCLETTSFSSVVHLTLRFRVPLPHEVEH